MEKPSDCIKPEQLKQRVVAGNDVLIIDVRTLREFEELHIPCALHIPIGQIDKEVARLHKHYDLVTVCTNGGGRSLEAAQRLKEMGRDVQWLCGGVKGYFS